MNDTKSPACDHTDDPDALRRRLLALLPALGLGGAAHAQDASKVQPGAYRVVLENAQLRVLEYRSRPGLGVCGVGMHSHPAHLTIALSAAKVRVKLPDGKTIVATNELGDAFWSEAETHEVENIGGKDTRALLVELKPTKKA
jgi:beta-alanine degradation protein BauB